MHLAISSTLLLWLVFCLAPYTHYLISVNRVRIVGSDLLRWYATIVRVLTVQNLIILSIKSIVNTFVVWFVICCRCSVIHRHVRTYSSLAIASGRILTHVIIHYLRWVIATSWLLVEHDILFLVWLSLEAACGWSIHNTVSSVWLSSVHGCCRVLHHSVLVCTQDLLLRVRFNCVACSLADITFI